MDRVRFGRALGYGARHAVKTLAQAVDAASTPGPAATSAKPRGVEQRREVQAGNVVRRGTEQARVVGRSVWKPLAKFSGVLWLQVTGTFFLLIAAYLSQGLWRERAAVAGVRPGALLQSHAALKYGLHAAAFAVFAYFAVGNFVRAYRRERR